MQFDLSCVYTMPSHPGERDLTVHPRKLTVSYLFLTNAFCYLRTYITCTKIRNLPEYSQCMNVYLHVAVSRIKQNMGQLQRANFVILKVILNNGISFRDFYFYFLAARTHIDVVGSCFYYFFLKT